MVRLGWEAQLAWRSVGVLIGRSGVPMGGLSVGGEVSATVGKPRGSSVIIDMMAVIEWIANVMMIARHGGCEAMGRGRGAAAQKR
jgi:hypothetical protein